MNAEGHTVDYESDGDWDAFVLECLERFETMVDDSEDDDLGEQGGAR